MYLIMSRLVKTVYIIIFAALIIKPFLIAGDVYFIPEPIARSLSNAGLLIIGIVFYTLHQRDIKGKEKEKMRLNGRLQLLNTVLGKDICRSV